MNEPRWPDAELSAPMKEGALVIPSGEPLGDDGLLAAAATLIEEGRRLAASSANAALTMTY